jgi:GTP-binding protein HflX
MTSMTTAEPKERVLLVGLCRQGRGRDETLADLSELARLADTAGALVVGRIWQERARPDPATLIGRGKAEEVSREASRLGAGTIVFDDELSPAQIRNLEQTTEAKVIDRSAVILDIFARRARTREAKIQVELAQMEYLLPRLTRRWTHLSRQAGGSGSLGLKGVGETQLELDRRLIRRKIARLKVDLGRIEKGRAVRRMEREGTFKAALVGYTNAGKSTLFNALGGEGAFVEDRLFATLDPTVRRCRTADGAFFLLIDTVGFLRKLPVDLVASFRSTLEETASADLLVHVVDLSHPRYEEQMATTNDVLAEMGVLDRPTVTILNKSDAVTEPGIIARARGVYPEALVVSAVAPRGAEPVRAAIGRALGAREVTTRVAVSAERGDILGRIHGLARVTERVARDGHIVLTLKVDRARLGLVLGLSGVQEVVA